MRPELQDIVDELSRLLDHPVTLEDRGFALVAFHSHGEQVDEVRQRSIMARKSSAEVREWFENFGIATATEPVRTPSAPELGVLARLCFPARWRDVTHGYLWAITEDREIDEALWPAAMDLASRAGALMAQQARTRDDLGFLLQDVLSTDPDTAEHAADELDARRIIRRGVPVAALELQLVRAPTTGAIPVNLWTLPRSVLAWTGEDHTTLAVPLPGNDLDPARELARQARALYLERLPAGSEAELVVGIGAPCPDVAELRTSWQQARLAARVLTGVPDLRPVAAWPELGVYRLLGCGPASVLAEATVDESVRRLLAHDDDDIRETALTYLRTGGSVQRTGAALNIHRQTVYYRLQRIEKITGLDLSRGEDLLLLHLGLTMAPALGLQPAPSR